jgi:hypothetical protein
MSTSHEASRARCCDLGSLAFTVGRWRAVRWAVNARVQQRDERGQRRAPPSLQPGATGLPRHLEPAQQDPWPTTCAAPRALPIMCSTTAHAYQQVDLSLA